MRERQPKAVTRERGRPQRWPEIDVICASEPFDFAEYLKSMGHENLVVDMLVVTSSA